MPKKRRTKTVVPLEFQDGDDREDALQITKDSGLVSVCWRAVGVKIIHSPAAESWQCPAPSDIAKHTPTFRAIGRYGFSVAKYAEIFVFDFFDRLQTAALKIGDVEVTLGRVTPLAQYVMDIYHDRDVYGEWDSRWSLRLWNCPDELLEAYVLNAHRIFANQHGMQFELAAFDYEYADEPEIADDINEVLPPAVLDIEPMRIYYRGCSEQDAASAALQFYRVLEFYSISSKHTELEALRRRADVNSREFISLATKLLGGDERGDICRLVTRLADASLLALCVQDALIDRGDAGLLGSKIYDLRNSIVHAKYDHRNVLLVPSVFEEMPKIASWRAVLRRLANSALDVFGGRHMA